MLAPGTSSRPGATRSQSPQEGLEEFAVNGTSTDQDVDMLLRESSSVVSEDSHGFFLNLKRIHKTFQIREQKMSRFK